MSGTAFLLTLFCILLMSTGAYLGLQLTPVPPFLLLGVALCLGSLCSVHRLRDWRVPPRTLMLGIYGMFGTNVLYILAFRYAPPVEANLIFSLWPLLTVVLSPLFLPQYAIRRGHLLAAAVGFSGTALIIGNGHLQLHAAHLQGYLYAGIGAFFWASYSLMVKRFPPFPNAAIGLFCLASGLLSLLLHALFEAPYAFQAQDLLFTALFGVVPLGFATFLWDKALKLGDPRIIGSLAYLCPLFSTLILAVTGKEQLSLSAGLAMLLIMIGALIGSFASAQTPEPQTK